MRKYIFTGVLIMSSLMQGSLKLTSSAFVDGGSIPPQYTCDGANISPALAWSDVPENTKTFALIVDDPDAPAKVWVHWVLFNIPLSTTQLEKNASTNSFVCGVTDFNSARIYGGPCPPSGEHKYQFTLYALDTMLDLPAGATKEELLAAVKNHIIEQATLIGFYKRVK